MNPVKERLSMLEERARVLAAYLNNNHLGPYERTLLFNLRESVLQERDELEAEIEKD